MSDMAEPAPLSGLKLVAAAFALALANFVVVLDMTIANVSVPHIAGGLAVSPTQGTWAITSYAVADAVAVPLTGWMAARFGSVRLFLMAIAGFGLFSFLCGLSSTLGMLIAFRVAQGFCGGPLMPLSQTLLLRIFPKGRSHIGMAIFGMTTTAAPIFGPILGGLISDNWSWPWIFFINMPVVALCMFAVFRLVDEDTAPRTTDRIDVIGLMLLIVAVAAFQIMIDTGREQDWFGSQWIVILAIVAALAFSSFVIWELTESHPVVDLRVFRHRGMAFGTLAIALGFGAFFASVVLTPLWLQQVRGYSATEAGYIVAWVGVFAVIMSPVAASLLGKFDMRISICLGILWLGVMSLLRAGWNTDVGYWPLALPQLLQGIGLPFYFIGLTTLVLGSVDPKETVAAASLMGFIRTLSGAIGTAFATTAWDDATRASRAEMVGTLNGVDGALSSLQAGGMSQGQSLTVVERLVDAQSATVGMTHVFMYAAVSFGLAAAIVWLAPRPKLSVSPMAAH